MSKNRMALISQRLDRGALRQLDIIARRKETLRSTVIREALTEYINKETK